MASRLQLETLHQYMDTHQHLLYDCLSKLVQIDTVNHITHGNENQGQQFLEQLCKELGMQVDRFTPDSVPGVPESSDYRPGRSGDIRENLVAVFPGRSESRILLAAHIDTMPLGDPKSWQDDPLSGRIQDGYIFGRGAGDDKSGLAAAWFTLKTLSECDIVPAKTLLLGSYADEEYGGGNGALAMAVKYPCQCIINLDSPGFEEEAFGGSCYNLTLKSVRDDKSIASVFDVFTGLNLIKEALEDCQKLPGVHIRLSSAEAGTGGGKEGTMSIAVYTDRSQEQTAQLLEALILKLHPQFTALNLTTAGFCKTTRYFHYGRTAAACLEADLLRNRLLERIGIDPDTSASCLSDLSLFLRYGTANSFNFGVPRGNGQSGGAHQANECVSCEKLLQLAKDLVSILL